MNLKKILCFSIYIFFIIPNPLDGHHPNCNENPFHPFNPARSAMSFRGSSLLKKQVAPLLGQPAFLSNRCASCLGVFLNSQYGQSSLSS